MMISDAELWNFRSKQEEKNIFVIPVLYVVVYCKGYTVKIKKEIKDHFKLKMTQGDKKTKCGTMHKTTSSSMFDKKCYVVTIWWCIWGWAGWRCCHQGIWWNMSCTFFSQGLDDARVHKHTYKQTDTHTHTCTSISISVTLRAAKRPADSHPKWGTWKPTN